MIKVTQINLLLLYVLEYLYEKRDKNKNTGEGFYWRGGSLFQTYSVLMAQIITSKFSIYNLEEAFQRHFSIDLIWRVRWV
ncbi:hypothetical protein C900_02692 [Fulvivirga imtechensis AK7]|uniref:Uncharacterized protein n=1 Tax=Fulvivirga imtechensis AK7 TaxID=1237149 RepID=L8K2D0_9BACT|nr:hypothetical protein C900_02692 [Fulvivirga imtechensis AK7]